MTETQQFFTRITTNLYISSLHFRIHLKRVVYFLIIVYFIRNPGVCISKLAAILSFLFSWLISFYKSGNISSFPDVTYASLDLHIKNILIPLAQDGSVVKIDLHLKLDAQFFSTSFQSNFFTMLVDRVDSLSTDNSYKSPVLLDLNRDGTFRFAKSAIYPAIHGMFTDLDFISKLIN